MALRVEGLSPAAVGSLVSTPTAGRVLSLLAWGAAADAAAAAPVVGVVLTRAVEAASRGAPPAVGAAAGR